MTEQNSVQGIGMHYADQLHLDKTLNAVPMRFRGVIVNKYAQKYQQESRQTANLYCLGIQEKVDKTLIPLDDEAIRRKADRLTLSCSLEMAKHHDDGVRVVPNVPKQLEIAEKYCKLAGIEPLAIRNFPDAELWEELTDTEQRELYRLVLPALKRMKDAKWYKRRMLIMQDRQTEALAIVIGVVNKYVSDELLNRKKLRLQCSLEALSQLVAISDEGDEIDMIDVLKASTANLELRRVEMMVRARGFEEFSKKQGHIAKLYTVTCPSKMHPNSAKYDGTTPREAQAYLLGQWAKVRAKLHRKGIVVYGFRVTEGHKDGCPHHHLLLFIEGEKTAQIVSQIMAAYALEMDGDEKGASEHRFDIEHIDPKKGSATGYLAKYISKNIDGFGLDIDDETGGSAEDGAQRVRAWASTWGLRQFQQIGGSSVTVWRLLRGMDEMPDDWPPLLKDLKEAADNGEFCSFCELQGGAMYPRKRQPVKPFYAPRKLPEEITVKHGELYKQNSYGETISSVQGVVVQWEGFEVPFITRTKQWRIESKAEVENQEALLNAPNPISFKGGIHPLDAIFSTESEDFSPWTRLNNCTGTKPDTVF